METNRQCYSKKAKSTWKGLYKYAFSSIAWNFAHSVLWNGQTFSPEEVEGVHLILDEYFANADNRQKAFIAFCERIIVAKNFLVTKEPQVILPEPSTWLNPEYTQGFAETRSWYRAIEQTRKTLPNHLKHYTVMARHYYQYAMRPCKTTISECCTKLLKLKAKNLLELFYTTIAPYTQKP